MTFMGPDPFAMAIFNSLGNAAANLGSGLADVAVNERNRQLGMEAVEKYVQDPSIINYLNASRYFDMDAAIKAHKTTKETEQLTRKTSLLDQQIKAGQDTEAGVEELAEILGVSTNVARLIQQNPVMKDVIFPQEKVEPVPGPFDHLSELEQKQYGETQEKIRKYTSTAQAARKARQSGSAGDLALVAEHFGLSPDLIKKMSKKDRKALSTAIEKQILNETPRDFVGLILAENPTLSPGQRRQLQSRILGDPEFNEFIAQRVEEIILAKDGIYNPESLLVDVENYVQKYLPKTGSSNPQTRPPGWIQMPAATEDGQVVAPVDSSTQTTQQTQRPKDESAQEVLARILSGDTQPDDDEPEEGETPQPLPLTEGGSAVIQDAASAVAQAKSGRQAEVEAQNEKNDEPEEPLIDVFWRYIKGLFTDGAKEGEEAEAQAAEGDQPEGEEPEEEDVDEEAGEGDQPEEEQAEPEEPGEMPGPLYDENAPVPSEQEPQKTDEVAPDGTGEMPGPLSEDDESGPESAQDLLDAVVPERASAPSKKEEEPKEQPQQPDEPEEPSTDSEDAQPVEPEPAEQPKSAEQELQELRGEPEAEQPQAPQEAQEALDEMSGKKKKKHWWQRKKKEETPEEPQAQEIAHPQEEETPEDRLIQGAQEIPQDQGEAQFAKNVQQLEEKDREEEAAAQEEQPLPQEPEEQPQPQEPEAQPQEEPQAPEALPEEQPKEKKKKKKEKAAEPAAKQAEGDAETQLTPEEKKALSPTELTEFEQKVGLRPFTTRDWETFKDFSKRAKKYDQYKDWTEEELERFYKTRKFFVSGMKTYKNHIAETDEGEQRNAFKREEGRRLLALGVESDLHHFGVKPDDAKAVADVVMSMFDTPDGQQVLELMGNNADGLMEVLAGISGYVLQVVQDEEKLPADIDANISSKLMDTAYVGTARAIVSALDMTTSELFMAGLSASISAAVGGGTRGGWIGSIAAGVGAAATFGYRFYKQSCREEVYSAFFRSPRSKAEDLAYTDLRYDFAERYKDRFTTEELKDIIAGTYTDGAKIQSIIAESNWLENAIDYLVAPVSTIDDKYFHIVEGIEQEHPNYDESVVRGMEFFGQLVGVGAANVVAHKAGQVTSAVKQAVQETKGVQYEGTTRAKQIINSARRQMRKHDRALRNAGVNIDPSIYELQYDERMNTWVASPGQETFQPYKQGVKVFKTSPMFRRAVMAAAYAGLDKVLDEKMEDSFLARLLLNMGMGTAGHILEGHYYRLKLKEMDINHAWQKNAFSNFAEDFGGTITVTPEGTVYNVSGLGKEIVYTPGSTMTVRPVTSPTPHVPTTGIVRADEFIKAQSSNLMSYAGVSDNLGIEVPNVARAAPSQVVDVELRDLDSMVQNHWETKKKLIAEARTKDLQPLLNYEMMEKVTGQKFPEGHVPSTAELKQISTNTYDLAKEQASASSTRDVIMKFRDNEQAIINHFANNVDFVDSHPKINTFLNSLKRTIMSKDFSVDDLFEQHKKLNKNIRDLERAQARDYKPEYESHIAAYKELNELVLGLLPEEARSTIADADAFYAAYKASKNLDDVVAAASTYDSIDTWLLKGNSFEKAAQDIYDNFKSGNIANVLKQSLLHDDYTRSFINKPNVTLLQDGSVISQGQAISTLGEFASQWKNFERISLFTDVGKFSRFATGVSNKVATLAGQEKAAETLASDNGWRSEAFNSLIQDSSQAHQLREINTPYSRAEKAKGGSFFERLAPVEPYNNPVDSEVLGAIGLQKINSGGMQGRPARTSGGISRQLSSAKRRQESLIKKIESSTNPEVKNALLDELEQQYMDYVQLFPDVGQEKLAEFEAHVNKVNKAIQEHS